MAQAKTNTECESGESQKVIGASQKVGIGFVIYSSPPKKCVYLQVNIFALYYKIDKPSGI